MTESEQLAERVAQLEARLHPDPLADLSRNLSLRPAWQRAKDRQQDLERVEREGALAEWHEAVRAQEEADRPKRERRDRNVAALGDRRDMARGRETEARREADQLDLEIRAIERVPLSEPIPLPACLQPRPLRVGPNPSEDPRARAFSSHIPARPAKRGRR